jgi:hypothetical protein
LNAYGLPTVESDTENERLLIGGGVRRGGKEDGGGKIARAVDGVEVEEVVFAVWGRNEFVIIEGKRG